MMPLLAACSVGPDYAAPPVTLPERYEAASRAQSAKPPELGAWWRRLGDPLLDRLMAEAVAGNLDVATAKAQIRQARATRRQAAAALMPTIDGSADLSRNQNSTTSIDGTDVIDVNTAGNTGPYTQMQAGFDATWELDVFGGNRRTLEAAQRGVEAAHEQLRDTLVTLVGDVAQNYVEARGYQARIALARRTAASQRDTAALTRRKFEAGSASAVDVAKAEAQAATTEATIPTLSTAYAASVHRLGVLLGREPGAVARRMERGAPIPNPRMPARLGVPADVLTTRPDVRAAERQLAQATANVGAAEAQLYPAVSLTGSISTNAYRLGDLGKSSSISWAFGPSLTVPVFNAGSLRAAVDITEAQRDESYLAFRSAVLTALEDVENASVSLTQERVRVTRLAKAAEGYRQAATMSRQLYQTGASSFLDVLDAERSLFDAEDSLIQSRVLVATSYVALNKALGGGWNGAVDTGTPEVRDVNTGPHAPKDDR